MANSASRAAMCDSNRSSERVTLGILLRRRSGICRFVFKLISDLRLLAAGSCALLLGFSFFGLLAFPPCSMLSAPCSSAWAQQPTKIPRIGYLSGVSPSTNSARHDAFRQGLRALGYVEGKNIFIEWRSAEGKLDRLPALAAELVHLNVDVIVTGGRSVTRAAKEVTSTIPIVMTQDSDPIVNGFVASLARPGGNITGLSTLVPELSGKQLELMKEIISKLSRVAVFGSSTSPGNAQSLREVDLAAGAFKVQLQHLDVLDPKDIGTAFRAASNGHADGVLVLNSPVFVNERRQLAELAVKFRLPAIYSQ